MTDTTTDRYLWMLLVGCMWIGSLAIAAVLGGNFVLDRARAEAAQIVATNARRVQPVTQIPQLIPCSKEGREEYARLCRARFRSAEIGGK